MLLSHPVVVEPQRPKSEQVFVPDTLQQQIWLLCHCDRAQWAVDKIKDEDKNPLLLHEEKKEKRENKRKNKLNTASTQSSALFFYPGDIWSWGEGHYLLPQLFVVYFYRIYSLYL